MRRIAWLLAIVACLLATAQVEAQQRKRASGRASAAHGARPAASKPASSDAETARPPAEPAPADDAAAAEPAPAAPGSGPGAEVSQEKAHEGEQKAPQKAKAESAEKPDSVALQLELAQLMDDLVQARERVAVIGKALFKTRVRVKLDNRALEEQLPGRVTLRLDGSPIFSADGTTLRDAERSLFDGFAAPGPHVLELELEQRARSDEAYRYTQRQSFRFEVVRERRTDLQLVLEDDSDIAEDFRDDREGEYDVRTRLQVSAQPLSEE